MSSRLEHRLFWLLIATLVWSVAMRVQLGSIAREDFNRPASCSYFTDQPILDVELAYPADCFRSVVEQGKPANCLTWRKMATGQRSRLAGLTEA